MKTGPIVRRVMVMALTVALCSVAQALVYNGTPSPVSPGNTYVYTTFGSGDVVFKLTSGMPSQCGGFWLRATDPGLKNDLAALMTAITTQTPVTVYADPTQIWTGSSTPYCLVYMIAL